MVALAIPTYSMSIFKIPRAVCAGLNSVLAKYWWGQSQNEQKIHWINWGKLCTPKDRGGVGFRDVHAFNLVMLAKQAWRLIHRTHSLFYRVYKARYFPVCSFLEAELGSNPSFMWRSLLSARELIREGLAKSLKEKLSRKELEMWAMVAWSIWNARNRLYFEASQTPPQAILKSAEMLLEDYQRLSRSMPSN
ncbi:putative mitochondrial protein AtMg00310 [Castanea sativa]|uniref:putative mitochondrial protein AtMg00310 n=1 Tax=Castanea sativa TaxID=21020 RepID=UPI003F64AC73